MARKIRFPLHMSDGADVRTIEELQEHFDLESVLGYFTDGKLKTWLEDRYYDEQAAAVGELSADMPDLGARLSAIFGIEHNDGTEVDLEGIQRRKEKLRILSAYTADSEILDNVDFVAMDQDELFDILDMSPEKVYLFGGEFSIPLGKKNVTYIGLNGAQVKLSKGKELGDYTAIGIFFKNIFSEEKNDSTSEVSLNGGEYGERLFLERKFAEAFPILESAANDGDSRAMYLLAHYYMEGYNVVQISSKKRLEWLEKAIRSYEPLSSFLYAYSIYDNSLTNSESKREKMKDVISLAEKAIPDLLRMANNDDPLAQYEIAVTALNFGSIHDFWVNKKIKIALAMNGIDVKKGCSFCMKSSEKGFSPAKSIILNMPCDELDHISTEPSKEERMFNESLEDGNAVAQYMMYDDNWLDNEEIAYGYLFKSAEQGYLKACERLAEEYDRDYLGHDRCEQKKWYNVIIKQGCKEIHAEEWMMKKASEEIKKI